MNDMERRLRDLGDDLRAEQRPSVPLGKRAIRRVRRRRIATAATGLVVVAALMSVGTYALGALGDNGSTLPPAQDGTVEGSSEVLYSYLGARARAVIELNAASGTVCYSLETVRGYGTFTRVEIVEGLEERTPVVFSPPPYRRTPLPGSTECVGNVEPSIINSIVASPHLYFLLIEDPQYGERVSSLTRSKKVDEPDCGPPVDFEPTYLPEGWIHELQGGGGGGGNTGAAGHYGNEATPGTPEKAEAGFADLFVGTSPYAISKGQEIRVLDEPTVLGEIHEGYAVDFTQHDCDYALVAYGVALQELREFAEGLRLPGEYAPAEPEEEESFSGLWPEDTREQAKEACGAESEGSWRAASKSVVKRFSIDVLAWEEAALERLSARYGISWTVTRSQGPGGPAVVVWSHEVLPGCWSVGSVARPPDNKPTGVSMSVRGRNVQLGFDPLGAVSADVEVGYGRRIVTAEWSTGDESLLQWRLDFDPDTTGHFLILFRGSDGRVFSAAGGPLPAGDFAAG